MTGYLTAQVTVMAKKFILQTITHCNSAKYNEITLILRYYYVIPTYITIEILKKRRLEAS